MTEVASGSTGTQLARTLGLWAIVGLGLGYMTPTVVFDTFGIVSNETGSVVPTAYMLALVVMVFTAVSYGRMTRIFPSAGSSYTYTSATISPNVGFLIGWAALLDYLLLPLVNALIIRSYMYSFFPEAPPWIWVVVYVACITAMCPSFGIASAVPSPAANTFAWSMWRIVRSVGTKPCSSPSRERSTIGLPR